MIIVSTLSRRFYPPMLGNSRRGTHIEVLLEASHDELISIDHGQGHPTYGVPFHVAYAAAQFVHRVDLLLGAQVEVKNLVVEVVFAEGIFQLERLAWLHVIRVRVQGFLDGLDTRQPFLFCITLFTVCALFLHAKVFLLIALVCQTRTHIS